MQCDCGAPVSHMLRAPNGLQRHICRKCLEEFKVMAFALVCIRKEQGEDTAFAWNEQELEAS